MLAAGLAIAILPFTMRNASVGGETVLLSANGGINFWIGNQAQATGVFSAPPGYDFRHDPVGREIAARALGHEPTWSEASKWWSDRAWSDIGHDPLHWVGLLARKAALFAHSTEIPQVGENFAWYRDRAWPLRLPLDASTLLILAVAAPFVLRMRGRNVSEIALPLFAIGGHVGVIVLFFVNARYRAPIMPLVIAVAAVSSIEIVRLLLMNRGWTTGLLLGAIAGVFAIAQVAYNGPLAVQPTSATEERHAGMSLYAEGRYAEAVAAYERALETEDDLATRTNLGNAFKKLGRFEEAGQEYHYVLARNPRDGITWYDLGNLMREQLHDVRGAIECYRNATEFAPQMPEAHFSLGAALLDLNDFEAAIAEIQTSLSLAPANASWRPDAERALGLARLRTAESKGLLPPPRK
jgi:tetratricopeptide (TPR) repeat protein